MAKLGTRVSGEWHRLAVYVAVLQISGGTQRNLHRQAREQLFFYLIFQTILLFAHLQTSQRIAFHMAYSSVPRQIEPCVRTVRMGALLSFH